MDTFVVRVWRGSEAVEAHAGSEPSPWTLIGVVRHVSSGSESAFTGPDELLRLLDRPVAQMGKGDRPAAVPATD